MKAFWSIAVVAALAAGPVHAACSYPQPPANIPNGETATMQEMVAAQKAIKEYDTQVNAYVACLKLEHDTTVAAEGTNLTEDQKKDMERIQIQKHNAAIDALEGVAARFNEQVKAYNAKNKKS